MDIKSTSIRALSGSIYVIIIILACWFGEIGLALLSSLFSILGIVEFRKMKFGDPAKDLFGAVYNVIGGVLLTLSFLIYPIFIWLLWLIGRMIMTIYSKHERPVNEFVVDIAAQVYIGVPMGLLTGLGFFCQDLCQTCMPILSIFILIWVNDTGAFLFGSLFGKHKLFPRVSPKKSWEGFWGGCLITVAVGIIIGCTPSPLSAEYLGNKILFWGFTGLIVSVASTYGDLFESVIKRNLHIKDSGNLIPGHGGILDRIDSLLMVIPAIVVYLALYAMLIVEVLTAYDPAAYL